MLDGREQVKTTDEGLRVWIAARSRGGMNALITGDITRIGKCVGLSGNLTIWPNGTSIDGDKIKVAGHSYGLGDHFESGGGVAEGIDFNPENVHAPKGCPVTEKIIIVTP